MIKCPDCGFVGMKDDFDTITPEKAEYMNTLPGELVCPRCKLRLAFGTAYGSFHFVLKRRGWGYEDIYKALKTGEKTSEWRAATDFWARRLLTKEGRQQLNGRIISQDSLPFPREQWKHKKARFVVGYTKRPMLIADVKALLYHFATEEFEVQIENVIELT